MRGATSGLYNDHLTHVKLKIWFKTGSIFEDIFSLEKNTFADVKCLAMKQFLNNSISNYRRSSFNTITTNRNYFSLDDINNYKLISIGSKRTMDDEKTLGQLKVKDGDEYILASKYLIQSSKIEQISEPFNIDIDLIESRTQNLSKTSRFIHRDYRSTVRNEFRTDLNRILITLIETSQKLLWCHPDAENIFRQAEEFLLRSTSDESNNPTTISSTINDIVTRREQINKLIELGFTEQQARIALKRTRYDLHAAMELILSQSNLLNDDDDDDNSDQENQSLESNLMPLFSPNGPFISFRKFRQQRFQANVKAIQSLKEMGFVHDDIITALRMFNNDKNLACDYLLSDKQQRQNLNDVESEQALDPNSSIFQSIIQNPIVQRTLNNPKTFFIMLQISENPNSITNYLNDPDIGNMLLQISRIYHAEKENMNISNHSRHDSDQQDETLSRTTESISGELDDDSD